MKPSGVGGMAVMEGVMMKNKDEYAVAVRKPNNEIVVEKSTYKDFSDKVKLFKLPIFRGMLAFVDSMVVGVKVLNFSASFFEEEEDTQTQKKSKNKKVNKLDNDFEIDDVSLSKTDAKKKELTEEEKEAAAKKANKSSALMMAFAVLFSMVLSVTLFMVIPVLVTNLLSKVVTSRMLMSLIEGILRLAIFIGYVLLASRMQEIKRVFMYHGAEHKTINCLENGFELTVENVRWQSKQHKRCGTSFMLLVILISLVFFIVIPVNGVLMRVVSRIVFVPFIAGVSYEFIRLAGKSESKLVHVLSQPGLWMQGLTTKEPDDSMIEVAIKSVSEVFDWRTFLEKSNNEEKTAIVSDDKVVTIPQAATKKSNQVKKNPGKQSEVKKVNTKDDNTKKDSDSILNSKEENSQSVNTVNTDVKSSNSKNKPSKNVSPNLVIEKIEETNVRPSTNRNQGIAPVHFKPIVSEKSEEEDDEILKALDKFFDEGLQAAKTSEAN